MEHGLLGTSLTRIAGVVESALGTAVRFLRRGMMRPVKLFDDYCIVPDVFDFYTSPLGATSTGACEDARVQLELLEKPISRMTPRELVVMLHHLEHVGALYVDRPTREAVSAVLRERLSTVECHPTRGEAPLP